jgi:hypothetical protein
MAINPNFKEFCEKNPDKGMIGMFWALYWRFVLVITGIYLLVLLAFSFWLNVLS